MTFFAHDCMIPPVMQPELGNAQSAAIACPEGVKKPHPVMYNSNGISDLRVDPLLSPQFTPGESTGFLQLIDCHTCAPLESVRWVNCHMSPIDGQSH